MSSNSGSDILKTLNPTRIIFPIIIGLAVVLYMVIKDFDSETFSQVAWTPLSILWLLIAILLMLARHYALMYRIRRLSGNKLSWWQSFDVITLWEFGSAATPSTIGGTAIALYLLTKEKIKAGETISVIMFTVVLDSVFFILTVPILWLFLGSSLFPSCEALNLQGGLIVSMFIGYLIMLGYSVAIVYGLFINPHSFKWLIVKLCNLPLLRRWRNSAEQTGNDMIIAAEGIRSKGLDYWLAGIGSTFAAWTIRFIILNFILGALITVGDHLVLYGRQFLMYILMLLAPTPGGSGIAEGVYPNVLCDFFLKSNGDINRSFAAFTSGLWRLVTYYPYLIVGVIVLPAWLRRVYRKTTHIEVE